MLGQVQIILPSYAQLQVPLSQVAVHVLPFGSLQVYVVGPLGPAEPEHVVVTEVGMLSQPGGGGGGGCTQLPRAVSSGTQPVACAPWPFTQVSAPGWAEHSRNAFHWLEQLVIAVISADSQLDSHSDSG